MKWGRGREKCNKWMSEKLELAGWPRRDETKLGAETSNAQQGELSSYLREKKTPRQC